MLRIKLELEVINVLLFDFRLERDLKAKLKFIRKTFNKKSFVHTFGPAVDTH